MPTFGCGSAGRGSRTAHVDARDVAAVAARCLPEGGHDGQAHTPTGPTALTYDECTAILSEVLGRPIRSTDPTPWVYWRAMARQGMPRAMIGVTLGIGLTDHADHRTTSIDHRQPTDVEFGERLGDIGERGLGLDGTRPSP